jgi:lipopolysaccharide export LptBFGC system permease protein LptF
MVTNSPVGESGNVGGVSGRAAPLGETMSMPPPAASPPPAADRTPEANEPTIEEYLAALLARAKQSPASPAETIPQPDMPTVEKVMPSNAAGPIAMPECRDAISELRELANISARSSFNTHRAQRLVLEMHSKWFVAVVAMLASLVLLSLASSVQSYAYMAAVVAVIAACVWSLNYLSLGRALSRICAELRSSDGTDD